MTAAWPWPGDTALDRARRIANNLLDLLPTDQRDAAAAQAHAVGETWLGGTPARWTPDDVVTTDDAAELVQVSPATIRKWRSQAQRGEGPPLPAYGRGRYLVRDVLACAAARRARRART